MDYDVFVSYTTADRAWAEKVEHDLAAGGLRVFRDQNRLDAGGKWETQLQTALDASQHLVVVWSNRANASSWVQKELARFDNHAAENDRRRLICLNLEGGNPAYSTFQAIDVLKDAKTAAGQSVYDAGPDAVDPALWMKAIAAVRKSLETDGAIRIAVAVLTLDSESVRQLTAEDHAEFTQRFGLSTDDVLARYGPRRLDWRPYGGPRTIEHILQQIGADLNAAAAPRRFRWEWAPDSLWGSGPERRQAAVSLAAAKLSAVVIDTVALKTRGVLQRTMLLRDYLKTGTCAWLIVPPIASDQGLLDYRELVRSWSEPLLNSYFEPPIPRNEPLLPHFSVFCGDDSEIKRLVRIAVGEYLATTLEPQRAPFTQVRD